MQTFVLVNTYRALTTNRFYSAPQSRLEVLLAIRLAPFSEGFTAQVGRKVYLARLQFMIRPYTRPEARSHSTFFFGHFFFRRPFFLVVGYFFSTAVFLALGIFFDGLFFAAFLVVGYFLKILKKKIDLKPGLKQRFFGYFFRRPFFLVVGFFL